jgi:hypothetical protein
MQQRIGGAYVAAPPSLQALEQQHQQMQSQPQLLSTPRGSSAPVAAAPTSVNTLSSASNTPAYSQQHQYQQQQPSPGSAATVPHISSAPAAAAPPSSASQVHSSASHTPALRHTSFQSCFSHSRLISRLKHLSCRFPHFLISCRAAAAAQ